MSLLASGARIWAVMVWALLRLSFDGQANVGSYRRFAQCLNLDHLTDTAIDKRFGPALRPLLGKWITRKRLPDNSYLYEAKVPAAAASDRYAILRPSDVDLLAVRPPKGLTSIEVGDLVDFCRWQLECGRRGWTIEPLRRIADRWKVTHPAIARSRDRLADSGCSRSYPAREADSLTSSGSRSSTIRTGKCRRSSTRRPTRARLGTTMAAVPIGVNYGT